MKKLIVLGVLLTGLVIVSCDSDENWEIENIVIHPLSKEQKERNKKTGKEILNLFEDALKKRADSEEGARDSESSRNH